MARMSELESNDCDQVDFFSKQFSIYEGRVDHLHAHNVKAWKEHTGLDEKEMPDLLRLKWDSNIDHTTKVTQEEAEEIISEARQHFVNADLDDDNTISMDEFINYLQLVRMNKKEEADCPLMIPREFVMIFQCKLYKKGDDDGFAHCMFKPDAAKLHGVTRRKSVAIDARRGYTGYTDSRANWTPQLSQSGKEAPFGSACATPCSKDPDNYNRCNAELGNLRFPNQYCRPCERTPVKFYFNLLNLMRMSAVAASAREEVVKAYRKQRGQVLAAYDELSKTKELIGSMSYRRQERIELKRLDDAEKRLEQAERLQPIILNPVTQIPFTPKQLNDMRAKFISIRDEWLTENIVKDEDNYVQRYGVPIARKAAFTASLTAGVGALVAGTAFTGGALPVVMIIIAVTAAVVSGAAEMHNIWNRRKLIRGQQGYWENTFTTLEGLDAALTCIYDAFTMVNPGVAGVGVFGQVASLHTEITNFVSDRYRTRGTAQAMPLTSEASKHFRSSVLLGLEYVRRELGQERQLVRMDEHADQYLGSMESQTARDLWENLNSMGADRDLNGFSISTNMLVLMADSFCRQELPLSEKFLTAPRSVDDLLKGKYLEIDTDAVEIERRRIRGTMDTVDGVFRLRKM